MRLTRGYFTRSWVRFVGDTVTKGDQSRVILDLFNKSAKDVGKDPFSLEKIVKPKICYSTDYDKAFKYIELSYIIRRCILHRYQ